MEDEKRHNTRLMAGSGPIPVVACADVDDRKIDPGLGLAEDFLLNLRRSAHRFAFDRFESMTAAQLYTAAACTELSASCPIWIHGLHLKMMNVM